MNRVSAVCAMVLVAAGLQVVTAQTAAAAEPREIAVVQPDRPANFLNDRILLAGNTGFLHRYASTSPALWTRYADGGTTVVDDPPAAWLPGGGDIIWARDATPGSLTALDLGTMTRRTYETPASGVFHLYGDTLLVRSGAPADWVLWRYAADGSHTTVPVTGAPAGANGAFVPAADSRTMVLTFTVPGGNRVGLLDLRSAAVTLLPSDVTGQPYAFLSAGHVAVRLCPSSGDLCQYRIFPRTGGAAVRTVDVPRLLPNYRTLLVGDHLISAAETAERPAVIDNSESGTPVVAPMSQAGQQTFVGGDTGGLFVGGTTGDWAVRRLTAGADGKLVQQTVHDLTRGRGNAGITLSYGVLRHIQWQQIDGDSGVRYHLFNHGVTASGSTSMTHGGELIGPKPCQTGVRCVRAIDGHAWGTAFLTGNDWFELRSSAGTGGATFPGGYVGPGAVLRDVSSRYVLADGPTGYVFDVATVETRRTRPPGASALWFRTIWSSPAAGTLRAEQAWSTAAPTTMSTGATCVPDEMQAALRHVYWSCGATGPAAVFDTARRVRIDLPAGRYLLGDNYVVRHDAATRRLLRYDLSAGAVGEPAVIATLPPSEVTDGRNITWAVDKYSGNMAWVDAAGAVHIVDPGVPRSAPALGGTHHYNTESVQFSAGREFIGTWDLSRRVDSWKVTITRVAGGAVVATRTGGATRSIDVTWDGRLASGEKAPSGRYRYTVDVTVDGATTRIDTNHTTVWCGPVPYRGYSCDGQVSALAVFRSGEAHWLTVTNGAIRDGGATEYWYLNAGTSPVTTALVPFGDLNRDGYNDLLARTSAGALVVHYGIGQANFGGRVTKTIGTGWGGFRQIVTSGDLTGDGIPDVLAQDSAGVLRRFNGTAAGGLANGVTVAGSWSHPKLVGPGDVTGDGRADLYAVNSAGQLDLFPGTGTGTFGAAQRIGSGWTPYTLIGIGDTNEDLRNDLVARDSAGVFWLYPGNGSGSFGARQQLATGFQRYQGLY